LGLSREGGRSSGGRGFSTWGALTAVRTTRALSRRCVSPSSAAPRKPAVRTEAKPRRRGLPGPGRASARVPPQHAAHFVYRRVPCARVPAWPRRPLGFDHSTASRTASAPAWGEPLLRAAHCARSERGCARQSHQKPRKPPRAAQPGDGGAPWPRLRAAWTTTTTTASDGLPKICRASIRCVPRHVRCFAGQSM